MSLSLLIVGTKTDGRLEGSYARAFQALGWEVLFWEPDLARYIVARGGKIGQFFSTFVHIEPWARKANLNLLQRADALQPNLILVIGTHGVRAGTLAQIRVRLAGCPIYCLYPDSPHNLDGERIHCLPFFDRVTTSSPAWVDAFSRLGAHRVHYLPFAADTDLHRPATVSGNVSFAHDVTFIGNWRQDRELLLEGLTDFDLCIWGENYWKTRTKPKSPLRQRWGGRPLVGLEFAQVCGESKIMLNVMDVATWPGPNMRTFEQPACRAFSLVGRTPAIMELFQEGETIECFATAEEAHSKIKYYLEHEAERQRLAEASYRFIVDGGHTYKDRARQLIMWAEEDKATAS